MIKKLLVIHQSAELYGSDRSLLDLLAGLDKREYKCIVCLPEAGPMEDALKELNIEYHILNVVKISRKLFSLMGLLRLPGYFMESNRQINAILSERSIDVVYTNTLAVLAGASWALINRKPHIWHIREIIRKPRLISLLFRCFARFLSTKVVCNSRETLAWAQMRGNRNEFYKVVWNGVAVDAKEIICSNKAALKSVLGIEPSLPLILMVGRVNAWKGQDLLMQALGHVKEICASNFSVAFVGSAPPGQDHFMDELKLLVKKSGLSTFIHVIEFTTEVSKYYEAADIAVVPSREPEPFGRVAIEAMATGIPVVAASHGGLLEIVDPGITGILFEPNNAKDLASALKKMLESPELRQQMGTEGKHRQEMVFSLEAYRTAMAEIFKTIY